MLHSTGCRDWQSTISHHELYGSFASVHLKPSQGMLRHYRSFLQGQYLCRALFRKHLRPVVTHNTFSFHSRNYTTGAELNPTISNASSRWLKWELDLLISKLTLAEVLPKSHVIGFLILSSLCGLRCFLSCCMTYMPLNARYRTN